MKTIKLLIVLILSVNLAYSQWSQQISGTEEVLLDIYFPSEQTGYIAGRSGLLLKTLDGGINWTTIKPPTSQSLSSVFFIDDEVGFIGSNGGYLGLRSSPRPTASYSSRSSADTMRIKACRPIHAASS